MNELSLTRMARELLQIDEVFNYHTGKAHVEIADFKLYTFVQTWGSTAGGMGGMGGCAITDQRTYVFIPDCRITEFCQVYFGSHFAYAVPYSLTFMQDVLDQNVAGFGQHFKYNDFVEAGD